MNPYIKSTLCLARKYLWRMAPRSADEYATHMPVLILASFLLRPQRVLELGSGIHSTPLFLNRDVFPDLKVLHSLENDPQWYREIGALCPPDPRLQRTLIDGPMSGFIPSLDLAQYDLVFVDDSNHQKARARTMAALGRSPNQPAMYVIHDCDQWRIRLALHHLPLRRFIFYGLNPQSCLCWGPARALDARQLRRYDRVLLEQGPRVEVKEQAAWRQMLWRERPGPEVR